MIFRKDLRAFLLFQPLPKKSLKIESLLQKIKKLIIITNFILKWYNSNK